MRLALRLAVQIEAGVDRLDAAGEALLEPPVERHQRPQGLGRGRRAPRGDVAARSRHRPGLAIRRRSIRKIRQARPSLERRNRARDPAPERMLGIAQPSPPRLLVRGHDRGFDLVLAAGSACRRDFGNGFLAPSILSASALALALPATFLVAFGAGTAGFARGSGVVLPASTMSSSRGMRMTKRPWWRMR